MTTGPIRADEVAGAPVACTLTLADQTTQVDRWRQLAGQAMTERTRTSRGVQVTFRADRGVEDTLRQLAAVESGCCAWATWNVDDRDGELVLNVSSATEQGVATLHEMLNGLWPQQR